ncbi:MAG: hypothetical protein INR69_04435 [Mucilaginibacter polytrichastri]|nr:hypothetical protein [Mucilaginibacter polytrichastri]
MEMMNRAIILCGLNVLEPIHGSEKNPEAQETDEEIEKNKHGIHFGRRDAKRMPRKGKQRSDSGNRFFEPRANKNAHRNFHFERFSFSKWDDTLKNQA